MSDRFLPPKGNYRKLIAFQKAECIYDITYYFAHTHLAKGDRTNLDAIQQRSAGTIANIAITLIHQTDVFLRKLLERLQQDFIREGGIKEQMYRTRDNYRKQHES